MKVSVGVNKNTRNMVMRKALVLSRCTVMCPPILSALKQNSIEAVYAENNIDTAKIVLEQKFDFIICCTETAESALETVLWLKKSSVVPISTRLLVFTKNVSREHKKTALLLGVTELLDIENISNYGQLFIKSDTLFPSRILLVEDNQSLANLLIHTLEMRGHQVVHHKSAKEAHNILLKEPFDLVVTDLLLEGNKTGQDLVAFLKRNELLENIPVLVATGYSDPAVIVDLLSMGAADVTTKPIIPEEFILRVDYILKMKNYREQLETQSKLLLELSLTDSLTGAFNRRFMGDTLAQRISDLKRKNEPFSVLMIDVDNFKRMNDKKGHLAGDEALKNLTNLVKNEIRNVDSFCRFGGEEFILILSDCDQADAIEKSEQLCNKIAKKMDFTVSIGLAVFNSTQQELTLESILHQVDSAVYKAKKVGKNQVVLASKD